MGKDDIRNAKVGDLVGIDTDLFKAIALVVDELEHEKYGRYFQCLILTTSEYEYQHINIHVSVLNDYPSSPRWYRIKT